MGGSRKFSVELWIVDYRRTSANMIGGGVAIAKM
jgi:hypothetical protein